MWLNPIWVTVLPKLKWPEGVWIVQSTSGLIMLDTWSLTKEAALEAANEHAPGNNWQAIFCRAEGIEDGND